MSNLVARDLRQRDLVRYRWSLVEGIDLPLGRTVKGDQLQTPWDEHIAQWQAMVRWEQGRLFVRRASQADESQPIVYNGQPRDEFTLVPGEGFVIGRTVFQLDPVRPAPSTEYRSSGSRTVCLPLNQLHTQLNPGDEQLDIIHTLLEQLQAKRLDLNAFEEDVLRLLLKAVRPASFAAILQVGGAGSKRVECRKSSGSLGVCEPLVLDACRQQSLVAHRWGSRPGESYPPVRGASWAVCAPMVSDVEGEGDLALYLSGSRSPAGRGDSGRPLPDDQLSLIAIVADILRSIHTVHGLKNLRFGMQEFFPKPIRELLVGRNVGDVFRTEQVPAAILFCDLRGFSLFSAEHSDQLMLAWESIQEALSLMTQAITNQYGCIGDFHGDAAMGFWGWPRRAGSTGDLCEDVRDACRAADTLRDRFYLKSRGTGPLSGFACGIGIAAGPVVAGMLGTDDQRKISVFGPAVNLAARLESMTKQLGASILIDQWSRDALEAANSDMALRVRSIAEIIPAGMDEAVRVFELMPPAAHESALPPNLLRRFNVGREAFEKGDWPEARQQLQHSATAGDGPSKFLLTQMSNLPGPPAGWTGHVKLMAK